MSSAPERARLITKDRSRRISSCYLFSTLILLYFNLRLFWSCNIYAVLFISMAFWVMQPLVSKFSITIRRTIRTLRSTSMFKFSATVCLKMLSTILWYLDLAIIFYRFYSRVVIVKAVMFIFPNSLLHFINNLTNSLLFAEHLALMLFTT